MCVHPLGSLHTFDLCLIFELLSLVREINVLTHYKSEVIVVHSSAIYFQSSFLLLPCDSLPERLSQ